MTRSTRLFEIIQLLRNASGPWTAARIAKTLEVHKRTVYRDIAALQAMRVPIEGEAGVGYILRPGYDLPPINFDIEEAEALTVGLSMIPRTGDKGLVRAAASAARKLAEAAPRTEALLASSWGPEAPESVDMSLIRSAIRQERCLDLDYLSLSGIRTRRQVRPVAMIYYTEAVVLAAWCDLRQDFRHFRADRMARCALSDTSFAGQGHALRAEWSRLHGAML